MSTLRTFEKTPAERFYYTVRFAKWLAAGEALDDLAWTVESPTDQSQALEIEHTQNDAAACTVWVAGGLAGHEYTLTVQGTTNADPVTRTKTKSFVIRVVAHR